MNQNQPQPGGGMGESVAELIRSGAAIIRVENEHQQQIAVQRPRDASLVLKRALEELELAPEYAKKAFYVIPYKDRSSGEEKIVEVSGVSIKGAYALARLWGNCASAGRVVDEDDRKVYLEGVFIDYETNSRFMRPFTAAKTIYRKSTQTIEPLREDRLIQAIGSATSKAIRNAIIAGLPEYLKDSFFAKARDIAASGRTKPDEKKKPLKQRVGKMFALFEADCGVKKEAILRYLKLADEKEIKEDHLGRLIGIYNSIEDGQAKASEIFDQAEERAPSDAERAVGAMLANGAGNQPQASAAITPESQIEKTKTYRAMVNTAKKLSSLADVKAYATAASTEGKITADQLVEINKLIAEKEAELRKG